jgi:tetratricopeptide (TPR) repeat protein/TolB-like protein
MGAVYQAWDQVLEVAVAVKVIRPESMEDLDAAHELERRFKRELLLARQVTHKNVVRIHDLGEIDGIKYITMPYIEGSDLATILRHEGCLPLARTLKIARQVAAGLASAHEAGIVHRDLKPANIMVDKADHALIMDFGIARLAAGGATAFGATMAGAVIGTMEYMAPEQARGESVDHRADIYAFGLILYDMLVGRRHAGAQSAITDLMSRMQHAPASPRSRDPQIPEAVDRIVLRCLQPDASARHQTTAELLQELQNLSADGQETVPSTRTATAISGISLPPSRRVPMARGLAAGFVLLLVVALAVLMTVPGTRRAVLEWMPGAPRTSAIPSPSEQKIVAVLPFRVLGDPGALEHIANGLSESLSAKLFQLKDVKVASNASIERVNRDQPPAKIAHDLGVNLLLTGTVRGEGDRIRIVANLEDTVNDNRIWTKEFPGVHGDLLTLEDKMFADLLTALSITPGSEERDRSASRATQNIEAYDLYLRGRNGMRGQNDPSNVLAAITAYEQALTKDPQFALAFAGLADAYLSRYNDTREQLWADKAVFAAQQAQRLDQGLLEVQLALGAAYLTTGKTTEAIVVLKRALELAPNSDHAHRQLARALLEGGRQKEAIAMYRKAVEINPFYWENHNALGGASLRLGDYDGAIAAFKKVVEIEPDNGDGWNNLGATYLQTARFEESIPVLQKALALLPTAETYTNLGIAYTSLGRYADAVPAYEKAVELNPNARQIVGNLADGYRWSGNAEKARLTYDKAIALAYSELQVNPRNAETKANLALFYAKRGDGAQAARLIREAREIDAGNVEIIYMDATVDLFANRRSEALAQLREAFRAGYPASFAKTDPDLKPLWTDAQFQRLVKEFEAK